MWSVPLPPPYPKLQNQIQSGNRDLQSCSIDKTAAQTTRPKVFLRECIKIGVVPLCYPNPKLQKHRGF